MHSVECLLGAASVSSLGSPLLETDPLGVLSVGPFVALEFNHKEQPHESVSHALRLSVKPIFVTCNLSAFQRLQRLAADLSDAQDEESTPAQGQVTLLRQDNQVRCSCICTKQRFAFGMCPHFCSIIEQADREWDHHDDQIRLALSVSSES